MVSLGKKILSAFVEVTNEEVPGTKKGENENSSMPVPMPGAVAAKANEKFTQYFEQLFRESNMPGPDYFEFAKMTQAMMAIADEKSRYSAAFAGLHVQGLDKGKLLNTASVYLSILEKDAAQFNSSVDAALAEKVKAKQQEITSKQQRIAQLNKEITDLQNQVSTLHQEVKENEEKIENNTGSYKAASENMKQLILADIEKIKQYIL